MTAPTSPGVVPADDERIAFTQDGIFRLNEDSQDMLDQWHRERGMETSRAYWKKRALTAEATLADRANRPSLTEDERGQVRREALEEARDAVAVVRDKRGVKLGSAGLKILPRLKTQHDALCEAVNILRALADRSEPRQEKEGKA